MIITLPAKAPAERRNRAMLRVLGDVEADTVAPLFPMPERKRGVVWGIDGGGPVDPHDTPCRPSALTLFAGGPLVPAWVARELRGEPATASQRAYLRRLGIADVPRDRDQASAWIDEARKWRALVP